MAGTPKVCSGNFETRFFRIVKGESVDIDVFIKPGLLIRSGNTKSDEEEWLLSGAAYDSCDDTGHAFVGMFLESRGDLLRIWQEEKIPNTTAVFSAFQDDELVVVSNWERKVTSPRRVAGSTAISFDRHKPRAENAFQLQEVVVQQVDNENVVERTFLKGASSVLAMDAFLQNDGVLNVFGSYAGGAMWAEFPD